MSCALTIGYSLGCKAGIGGLSSAWLVEHSSLTSVVEDTGVAQIINVTGSWRKYELHKQSAQFTEVLQRDGSTGLVAYNQTFDFVINSLSATMRNELMRMAKKPVLVVVKDRRGDYWLLGKESGLLMASKSGGSGKQASDRSGYSVSLEGQEEAMALKLSTTAAGIIDPQIDSNLCYVVDGDGNYIIDGGGTFLTYTCDNGEFSGTDFDFNDFNV